MSRDIILTFDDGDGSHYNFAAPLLRQYGFNATFYVNAKVGEGLTDEQLCALSEHWEIGNHTAGHFFPDGKAEIQEWQYRTLEERLERLGIRTDVCTFAYPGGPYTESGAAMLKQTGRYIGARSNERRLYHPEADDPFHIPAFAVADKYPGTFEMVMELWEKDPDAVPVLVWHGIPGPLPECATTPDAFRQQMEQLAAMNCNTWSLRDFLTGKR